MAKYNAANLMQQLENKGLVNKASFSDFVLNAKRNNLPIYMQIISGIGAFIAMCFLSLFFIVMIAPFYFEIESFTNQRNLMIIGLVVVAFALFLNYYNKNNNTDDQMRHCYIMQLSVALMATGKFITAFSLYYMTDSYWGVSLALLLLNAITFCFFKIAAERFLATIMLLYSTYEAIIPNLFGHVKNQDFSFILKFWLWDYAYFLVHLLLLIILLANRRLRKNNSDIAYAFVFSFVSYFLFSAMHTAPLILKGVFINYFAYNIFLTLGLIALLAWLVGDVKKIKKMQHFLMAILGLVLLAFVAPPGFLFALGLLIFGYAKHEKILVIIGILMVPCVLWFFYYENNISLLHKSSSLIIVGILCLIGWLYLKHKGWDKAA